MFRLAVAIFAVQAGFHGFTASLPLALYRAGLPDAQIGVIVGIASVVQVPAALVAGALIDRFGGLRLFWVGAAAYLAGALVLLVPGVEPGGSALPFLAARVLQGIGIASVIPSALSLVSGLVPHTRQGFGLAFIGSAHNLTMGIMPPISLAILGAGTSLHPVALTVVAAVLVGAALSVGLPARGQLAADVVAPEGRVHRRFGLSYRTAWTLPLLMSILFVAHWGVVVAYLPQRAELAGASVGPFFAADALAIIALRVPTGWLADRVAPRRLVLAGLFVTLVSLLLLLPRPTTTLLILAGIGTGAGGGLIVSPLLLELSRRSSDADRGSAFALFSVAFALALALGSVGGAPIVALGGFEPAMVAGIAGVVGAGLVALVDPSMRGTAPVPRVEGAAALAGPAADGPGIIEVPQAGHAGATGPTGSVR